MGPVKLETPRYARQQNSFDCGLYVLGEFLLRSLVLESSVKKVSAQF